MTTFTMTVEMDNAAFEEPHGREELSRVLHRASAQVLIETADCRTVLDINGNTVGRWEVSA